MRRLPTIAVAGLSIAIGFLTAYLLYKHAWRIPVVQNLRGAQLFCALWILAMPVTALLTALARATKWRTALTSAAICLGIAAPLYALTGSFEKVRTTSRDKAVLCNLRQLAAAADQYCLENNGQVVERLEELVGPTEYIKALNAVAGEDYRENFPVCSGAILSAEFPSGRIINYASGPTPPGYQHVYEPGEIPPWRTKKSTPVAPGSMGRVTPVTGGKPAPAAAVALSEEALRRELGKPTRSVRRGTMCASCHAKKS